MILRKVPQIEDSKLRSLLIILLIYYLLSSYIFITLGETDSVFFLTPKVDELTNLHNSNMLIGGGISKELFWQEPGTYVYLGLIKLAGFHHIEDIKGFQAFFVNPLIIVLVFWAANMFKSGFAIPSAAIYAFSPLSIFFSMTAMKTTLSIFCYLLWFISWIYLLRNRKSFIRGLLFGLSFFLAFCVRQHIVVLLPVAFLSFLNLKPFAMKERKNLLVVALIIVIFVGGAITFSSLLQGHPVLTLTSNGKINFYISNSEDINRTMNIWPGPTWKKINLKIRSGELDPYGFIKKDFTGWLKLMAQKSLWEFTPYNYFRMYHWGYFTKLIPLFKTAFIFNLIIISLVISNLLFWKSLDRIFRYAFIFWGAFHGVNIIFIPGIARYNTVILPISIFLALKGAELLWKKKGISLIIVTLILVTLTFNRVPNGFNEEYLDFIVKYNRLLEGEKVVVKIPPDTSQMEDWMVAKAASYLNLGFYKKAWEKILKVPEFYKAGEFPCKVAELAASGQGFYFDALRINGLINSSSFRLRRKGIEEKLVSEAEIMLERYRQSGNMSPYRKYLLANYYYGICLQGLNLAPGRKHELLKIASSLVGEALLQEEKDSLKELYKTLLKSIDNLVISGNRTI